MKWGKFFQKLFQGFLAGGIASVSGQLGADPSGIDKPETIITAGVVGILAGLVNWWKHK